MPGTGNFLAIGRSADMGGRCEIGSRAADGEGNGSAPSPEDGLGRCGRLRRASREPVGDRHHDWVPLEQHEPCGQPNAPRGRSIFWFSGGERRYGDGEGGAGRGR